MLTRRSFIFAGGSAMGAVALANAAGAAVLGRADVLTIASANRPLAAVDQDSRHIILSGHPAQDLATLEKVLADAPADHVALSLDAADDVLMDVASSRVASAYVVTGNVNGARALRRNSAFVGA